MLNTVNFKRNDTHIILDGKHPIDKNDPQSAASAIELALPTGFSEKAKACWKYFDDTAFLFEYKGKLVVTDESLWLTAYGNGTLESPLGFPRFTCDSWEELEKVLELTYDDERRN